MNIKHSAKGSIWKEHKYIAIKNGRYIYPEERQIEKLQNERDNLQLDYSDEKRQNTFKTIDAFVKSFNQEYLGRSPESLGMIETDMVDDDGDPVYMEANEYLDYLAKKYDDYEIAIADKDYKIAELQDELNRKTQIARR